MNEKRDWWIVKIGEAEQVMLISDQEVWLLGEQIEKAGLIRAMWLERYRRGYCPGCGAPAHIAHARFCNRAEVAVGSKRDHEMFWRRWTFHLGADDDDDWQWPDDYDEADMAHARRHYYD